MAPFPANRDPWQAMSRGRDSGRAIATNTTRLDLRAEVALESMVTHDRSAHRRSSIRAVRVTAVGTRRWRQRRARRDIARCGGNRRRRFCRDQPAVRGGSLTARRTPVTAEAMTEIYQAGHQEADAMFKQSRTSSRIWWRSMKQMVPKCHNELEATRNELRRGVMEMPRRPPRAPRRAERDSFARSRALDGN